MSLSAAMIQGNLVMTNKHIIALFGGAVLLYLLVHKTVIEPTREAVSKQKRLEGEIVQIDQTLGHYQQAIEEFDVARGSSLTADPVLGMQRYQQWLLKRMKGSDRSSVSASLIAEEVSFGWLAQFQINCEASMEWIAELVNELELTPLTHRIRFMKVDRVDRSDSFSLSCTLETAFLRGSSSIGEWPLAERKQPRQHLLQASRFTRGYQKEREQPERLVKTEELPREPVKPQIDPLATVQLIGLVDIDQVLRAWIVDQRTGMELQVLIGETFAFGEDRFQVVEIGEAELVLQSAAETLVWSMGKTLRQAVSERGVRQAF